MNYYPIGRDISLLYRAQQMYFKYQAKSFDIGGGQLSFIFTLYHHPGASQDEIAKRLELDKTTVTRAALKLEGLGVIERKKDEQDLRVIRLHLTEKGLIVHDELKNAARDWHDVLVKGMSQEELNLLQKLTAKMAENARNFKNENCSGKDN